MKVTMYNPQNHRLMRTKLLTLCFALMASLTMSAQYVVSDKYDLWFEDTNNEMTTRKPEYCTEHYQDLPGGCQVRLSGRRVYIYRNGYSILYGDEINVLYNGYYRVRRGNTWYLADEDGDLVSGIYGKEILYYPFGYVTIQRSGGYWDIFHCSGANWRPIHTSFRRCSETAFSASNKANGGTLWTKMVTRSPASMATISSSSTTAHGNASAAVM